MRELWAYIVALVREATLAVAFLVLAIVLYAIAGTVLSSMGGTW